MGKGRRDDSEDSRDENELSLWTVSVIFIQVRFGAMQGCDFSGFFDFLNCLRIFFSFSYDLF